MEWKKISLRVRYRLQYFPLSLNGILLLIAGYWCYKELSLEKVSSDAPSSFTPFLILMGETALWFLLALIAFSFLSVLFSYLYFLWRHKKKGITLKLAFNQGHQTGNVSFQAIIDMVRRPWLGTVRCRLIYDNGHFTPKLALLANKREKGHFFRKRIFGQQALTLPDIKEYELKGSFLYFEDLLHLFSFPVFLQQKGHFFQKPKTYKSEIKENRPTEVVTEAVRTDESRRISGDFLNYKDFEGGDDIRRIVWQVYAKSGDLVVRIPEQRNFYASHITFYASFHTEIGTLQRQNDLAAEMLNYYKNCVWTALVTLLKKEIPLKFIPDKPLQSTENGLQEEQIQKQISHSDWHSNNNLTDYFHNRKNGILCISSFTNPEDLNTLLENTSREVIIYFVPLSQTFKHFIGWGWLKRIFVKAPEDRLKRIRSRWPFSPLKYRISKREKAILQLLEEHEVRWGILKRKGIADPSPN